MLQRLNLYELDVWPGKPKNASSISNIMGFLRLVIMAVLSMGVEIAATSAQVFQNTSFEGAPSAGLAPPDWFICTGTPDIQPGFWGTTQTPSNGNTYLGFHHEESVSAFFPNGIGLCSGLQFTMDVSIVPLNLPGNSLWESNNQGVNPGYICIYGGFSSCDFQELLWQSELLTNVSTWQSIDIQLTATQNFTYLNFAPCVNAAGSWTYFGIDNIQGVVNDPVPVDVGPPQTVCIGEPIQLSASFTGATSYSWTGPNGFTSNEQNPTIAAASAANSGTYTVTANVGTCQSAPTAVDVTVNNCASSVSGIINEYTPVTAFNPCNNSVTVGNSAPFETGDRALIIQMKGATVDLSNSPAFGNITNLGDAGNYELVEIAAVNGNEVQFANTLLNSYTVSGLVQLITVPQYTDVNVTGTLTCMPWNGTVGGVLVFEASGTVNLNGDMDVSDKGFMAGTSSSNAPYSCNQQDYFYSIASTFGGRKGEGVCALSDTYINGRGKNANGGGGGNDTNSGGAGGGNYGAGGRGGNQWSGCPNLAIGGEGGSDLNYNNGIDNRIFLGGGGGGGHQNDGVATPGTRGGGIVILRASQLAGLGGSVRANSLDALPSSGDGAGGAGAGGTVVLDVNTVSGNLTVDITGGNGGNNNSHGPGGGGGGGLLQTTNPLGANVTVLLQGGQAGIHSQSGTTHGATNGINGGVLSNFSLNESTTPWSPLNNPLFNFNNPCIGETLTLSAAWSSPPAVTFTWTGPSGFNATGQNASLPDATPSNNGTYTLSVTDAIGCTASWDTLVTVLPNPVSQQSVSICEGESYTLPDGAMATQEGTYQSVFSSAVGCDSTVVVELIVNQNTSSFSSASACVSYFWNGQNYNQSGSYTYQTLNAAGCDSIANLDLVINTGAATSLNDNACGSYTWSVNGQTYTQSGSYTEVLSTVAGCDSVVTLDIIIQPEYTVFLNESICEGEDFLFGGISYLQSGAYVQELTTLAGCDSTVTLNLTVNPLPQLDADSTYSVCTGQTIVLSGPELNEGSMLWNTGETGRSISVSQAGDYVLSVVTPQGCQASGVYTVLEYPVPNPVLNRDFVFCPGDELLLDAGNPGSTYLWNDGSTDRIVPVVRPGFYTVLITNDAGCQLSAFAQVIDYCDPVIYVPSSFTPDSDGVNDYFLAVGEYIDEFEMTIFNRWGEPIFQSFDINRGWDGSFLGGDFFVPDLIAAWLIRYKPQPAPGTSEAHWHELKGHVVILR